MEHYHGGLEAHFPFYIGDLWWFVGSMLIFQGVKDVFLEGDIFGAIC